jgi:hypothetical protein
MIVAPYFSGRWREPFLRFPGQIFMLIYQDATKVD